MPVINAVTEPDSKVTGSRLSLRAPSRQVKTKVNFMIQSKNLYKGSSLSLKAPSRSGSRLSVRDNAEAGGGQSRSDRGPQYTCTVH